MIKYLLSTIATIFYTALHAQTVVLERTEDGVMDSTFSTIFTEESNSKWVTSSVNAFGLPVSPSNIGSEIEVSNSVQIILGSATMYSLAKFFSAGLNVTYNFYNYRLAQTDDKILPVPYAENNIETIRFNCLQYGPVIRFNFTPNKFTHQKTLDIGGDMVWVMGSNHRTTNENEDGSIVKVKTRKLNYTEKFQYMAYARVRLGIIGIYGSYRLTDAFKEEFNYPELPNLNIGIMISSN